MRIADPKHRFIVYGTYLPTYDVTENENQNRLSITVEQFLWKRRREAELEFGRLCKEDLDRTGLKVTLSATEGTVFYLV